MVIVKESCVLEDVQMHDIKGVNGRASAGDVSFALQRAIDVLEEGIR